MRSILASEEILAAGLYNDAPHSRVMQSKGWLFVIVRMLGSTTPKGIKQWIYYYLELTPDYHVL